MTTSAISLTPPMQRIVAYFGELGPRWGLQADTCRAHAVLFLSATPVDAAQLAATLELGDDDVATALADLVQWRMANQDAEGRWTAAGEPWDLLFTALEERRRREVQPALRLLRECEREMAGDARTPAAATQRTAKLLRLVEDLAAIDLQASRIAPSTLSRMATFGGRLARLIDRITPSNSQGTHDD